MRQRKWRIIASHEGNGGPIVGVWKLIAKSIQTIARDWLCWLVCVRKFVFDSRNITNAGVTLGDGHCQ